MADVASEDNAEYLGEIFCVNLDTLNIGVIELLWTPSAQLFSAQVSKAAWVLTWL